jgi:beta-1,2-mannobiose phosphorylase / 1,2-beta-oligomannan phosphorylase
MAQVTVTRSPSNPLVSPDKSLMWQSAAAFNPSVVWDGQTCHMLYRALSAPIDQHGRVFQLSTVGYAESLDGVSFSGHRQLVVPEHAFERFGCEDPRVTKIDGEYFICYTALSDWPPSARSIKVGIAFSKDLKTITEKHLVTPFNAKAMTFFPEKINGKYVALLSVNTDSPPSQLCVAVFDKKEDIWSPEYWSEWYANLDQHKLYLQRMNTDHVEVGATPVKTDAGWVLVYSHIQNYHNEAERLFGIEAVLLDLEDPRRIIGRTTQPLFQPEASYEREGMIPNIVFPSGAFAKGDDLFIYYGGADTVCAMASLKLNMLLSLLKQAPYTNIWKFHKYPYNPVLSPQPDKNWQAQAVFNAGALYEDGKFYMIFRAMSPDNTSTLGLAVSTDGFHYEQPCLDPIYVPRMDFEMKKRPNDFSGCEDPRLTKFGDRIYMFYTAYDGISPPCVALSSIKVEDFIRQNWIWTEPIAISDLTHDNKNACLFPEKINDKFVVLHRAAGRDIAIDYLDTLNFPDTQRLEKEGAIQPRDNNWDSAKIGIAGPPIKTDVGWLLIYHGVSKFDKNYRLGYMILDLNDPFHILYRSPYPILEPEYAYEKEGIVNNVVFCCGAVEKDGVVYLMYGGADKVMAMATFPINKLLEMP